MFTWLFADASRWFCAVLGAWCLLMLLVFYVSGYARRRAKKHLRSGRDKADGEGVG